MLFLFFVLGAFPQTNKTKKMPLSEKMHIADSLRLELRRAADEGRMLQWGDSMLSSRLNKGEISKSKYEKLRHRLYKYDRALHKGDSLLAGNYNKVKFDTLYIGRPNARWTIKLRGNISGARIETEGKRLGTPYHAMVKSDYRGTMSVAVAYRGLAIGLALNPAKLAGKSKDNEFNLNSYSNKFGFDVVILSSKTYKGYAESDGVRSEVSKGMVSQKALNVNAYYAFNGRRFSFPAAFTQSYIQRRSAGSILAGFSFDGQITDIAENKAIDFEAVKLKIFEVGIGAGYGYNLVANKHLLFHLSALPTFDVFVNSHISSGEEKVKMDYHFPSVIVTGRGAAVYSWKNKFAGVTMVYNFSAVGDMDNLHVNRDKWRLRLFYGFRF